VQAPVLAPEPAGKLQKNMFVDVVGGVIVSGVHTPFV
jgi:hypothetical protein